MMARYRRDPGGSPRRRRPRFRWTEFQLLVLPVLLLAVGLLTVVLVSRGSAGFTWRDLWLALAFGALVGGISLGFSAVGFRGDQLLLPLVGALSSLGLLAIERLAPALERLHPGYGRLAARQVAYLAVGLVVLWYTAVHFRHLHLLRRYKYTLALAGVALMVATLLFGREINGARLWLRVGPIDIETAELLKLILVFFLAGYLDDKRELLAAPYRLGPLPLPPLPYLLPMVLLWGAALVIVVAQQALGMAFLYFGIFLTLLYVASGKLLYVVGGLGALAGGVALANRLFARVGQRVAIWLDPWPQGLGVGYQIIQGQYALASGGLFGTGLGSGHPTLIPEVQTDFVFAALGEELGLLGTLAVLALYLLLAYRGLHIALHAADGFARLVAVGLATILGLQALIIMGGVVRLIPLTGVPLPFISYGGSSLLTNCFLVGLLLNISDPRRGALPR